MNAKQEYENAVAMAYANRLRVENDAIRARQKAEASLDKSLDIVVMAVIIIVSMWVFCLLVGWW